MKIHFIGIGGIGVSAIARHYLESGCKISGSDLASSDISESFKKAGAKIIIGEHNAKNLPSNIDKIIYSPAVQETNPELKEAKKLQSLNPNIKILSYPQALGELAKNYYTIAVCGTHGKSTTSSMIGLAMIKAEKDPTIVVGTKLKELNNSNYRKGKSKYLVIEACEHFASFLNYWPQIIILTNIELDHLDFYKNLENYSKSFKKFIKHLPETGCLIANKDDENTQKLLKSEKNWNFKIINYSLKQKEAKILEKILKIPGKHNISNGLAALEALKALGIKSEKAIEALSEFKGSWRRFEQGEFNSGSKKFVLIDDYAHHPAEISATLKAAREKFSDKKICCFFQPHQYKRTDLLFKDFVKVLEEASKKKWADKIFITDIYDVAGREDKLSKKKVSAQKLAGAVKSKFVSYLPKEEITPFIKDNLEDKEIILAMGAGNIYQVFHKNICSQESIKIKLKKTI
ncbi:MAG: UDP-N-acetylmuramate--L-alanine ligase [Candidatus Paceibacterota bacterium]|jgi:UDP-N-acetylmuramate--alanine ligase